MVELESQKGCWVDCPMSTPPTSLVVANAHLNLVVNFIADEDRNDIHPVQHSELINKVI